MKNQNLIAPIALFLLVTISFLPLLKAQDKDSKGTREVAVQEADLYELRYSASDSLNNAEAHLRDNEQKAAANELLKAGACVQFAASYAHVDEDTKKSLQAANESLRALADDLNAGNTITSSKLDDAIAQASHALAAWHYFTSRDQLVRQEERYATGHLQAASRYLKEAAASARKQLGDDFVTTYDDIFASYSTEEVPNDIEGKLETVKVEIDNLSTALQKAGN